MSTTLSNPAVALPEPETDDNAERACHWFALVQEHGRMTLEAAANLGEVLIEQRDLCRQEKRQGGSGWSQWCEENLPFDRRSASRYIAIAENWGQLGHACASSEDPLSIREAVKRIGEIEAEDRGEEREQQAEAEGAETSRVIGDLADVAGETFRVIYADPPWRYDNQGTRAATDNHYPTMTVQEIAALPVANLAGENSQCHLWTTNGFLKDAFGVMEAWGFSYRSMFVWCKPGMGIGNYWRVSHELLLCGVRGSATFRDRSQRSWAELDRGRHSAKPEAVRGMIERAAPGPYLEMFGRRAIEGWTVFGNEIPAG